MPRHPEMARLLRDVDYLEKSLLARPQTLANVLSHPEAIEVLVDCVDRAGEDTVGPHVPEPCPPTSRPSRRHSRNKPVTW